METDYENFLKYSSSSNEITTYYELTNNIPDEKDFTKINSDIYEHVFSSDTNKYKFFGYITISKNATLWGLKNIIIELIGFPFNIIRKGSWGGKESDENGKIRTIFEDYNDINDDTLIMNSWYNNKTLKNRYIYINLDKIKE